MLQTSSAQDKFISKSANKFRTFEADERKGAAKTGSSSTERRTQETEQGFGQKRKRNVSSREKRKPDFGLNRKRNVRDREKRKPDFGLNRKRNVRGREKRKPDYRLNSKRNGRGREKKKPGFGLNRERNLRDRWKRQGFKLNRNVKGRERSVPGCLRGRGRLPLLALGITVNFACLSVCVSMCHTHYVPLYI